MDKLISYCLFGNEKKYIDGAIWNARNYKDYFPDWNARFYVTENIDPALERYLSKHAEIFVCEPEIKNMYSVRFLPLAEDNICIFRDTDSRFTERDVRCVNEWLDTNINFHTIRDHPYHINGQYPIMGGLWGKRGTIDSKIIHKLINSLFKDCDYNVDQDWLRRNIWKHYKEEFMIHQYNQVAWMLPWSEEYYCGKRYE